MADSKNGDPGIDDEQHYHLDAVIAGVRDGKIRRNLDGAYWRKLAAAMPDFYEFALQGIMKADHQGALSQANKENEQLKRELAKYKVPK